MFEVFYGPDHGSRGRVAGAVFLALTLMLSLSSFAQSQPEVGRVTQGQPAGDFPPPIPPGPGEVLWDNTNVGIPGPMTGQSVFSLKAGNLEEGENLVNAAKDFSVPEGEQWEIEFVWTIGLTLQSDADAFGVAFYDADGDIPGDILSEQEVPLGPEVSMSEQRITLPEPVTLNPGRHFLSVFAVYDDFQGESDTRRWLWRVGPDPSGDLDGVIQDQGGFLGAGVIPWSPITALGLDDPSNFFALRGNSTPLTGPPPEATAVPIASNWMLLTLLVVIGFLGAVFARRIAV